MEYQQDLQATNWLLPTNVVGPTTDLGFGLGGFQWQDALDSSASRLYRVRPEAP